jgi:hypothetical protein
MAETLEKNGINNHEVTIFNRQTLKVSKPRRAIPPVCNFSFSYRLVDAASQTLAPDYWLKGATLPAWCTRSQLGGKRL